MTAAPVVVLLLVSGVAPQHPLVQSAVATALLALPAGSTITIEAEEGPQRGGPLPDVVAHLFALDGAQPVVRLDVDRRAREVGRERLWFSRRLQFADGDDAAERGRSVGFLLAAILNDEHVAPEEPTSGVDRADEVIKARSRGMNPGLEAQGTAPPPRHDLTAAVAATTFGNAAGGVFGGAVRFGRSITSESRYRVHAGSAVRFGAIPVAQATTTVIDVGVGLSASWQPAPRLPALSLSIRTQVALQWLRVAHLSSDDPAPDVQSRLQPAGTIHGEVAWEAARRLTGFLSLGAEAVPGHTALWVKGRQVATVSAVRLAAEAGFRFAF